MFNPKPQQGHPSNRASSEHLLPSQMSLGPRVSPGGSLPWGFGRVLTLSSELHFYNSVLEFIKRDRLSGGGGGGVLVLQPGRDSPTMCLFCQPGKKESFLDSSGIHFLRLPSPPAGATTHLQQTETANCSTPRELRQLSRPRAWCSEESRLPVAPTQDTSRQPLTLLSPNRCSDWQPGDQPCRRCKQEFLLTKRRKEWTGRSRSPSCLSMKPDF